MKSFLADLADTIIRRYPRLEELTIVFPNRRAALFFQAYLTASLTRPAWSPALITIEELFLKKSDLQEADHFGLVHTLYQVYRKVLKHDEPFDRFYFWGEMLLRDFDELDKYLIAASQLFEDLSHWKELDESFDYLTEEQRKFLRDFWANFENNPGFNKEEFLRVWRALPFVYKEFAKALRKEGLGYEGMIHRDIAEHIRAGKFSDKKDTTHFVFVGFNALTKAEEELMSYYVQRGAEVFWDTDVYYVDDEKQEAGRFFRQYRSHSVLGKTFPPEQPDHFKSIDREIKMYGAPQKVGQAKLLGQLLEESTAAQGASKLRSVVVLPDESMLMPVLHSVPESIGSVNVTMGYSLQHTPMSNLIELLIELQLQRRGEVFNHQAVTSILSHAYVVSRTEVPANDVRIQIITDNMVYIPADYLMKKGGIFAVIFKPIDPPEITAYLLEIVQQLGAGFSDRQSFDREYAYHFHRSLSRLHDVLKDSGVHPDLRGFQKLFRQIIQSQKIPFSGEPLKGLQVMGVLETRNLDFDNVYVLSLNEGAFPASPRMGSYIPHGIRKAYGLPTYEQQDAIYAYLFYRVLQRARRIHLLYNTEPDTLGSGEMSRLLQQLRHESGWKIDEYILSNPIRLKNIAPVVVAKTENVMKALSVYTRPDADGLSPSALNDFIECSLRFYLRHLARLREADTVEEDLNARNFGNFVHHVMDSFYRELIDRKQSRDVERTDLAPEIVNPVVRRLIDNEFRQHYSIPPEKAVVYQGNSVVVSEIVRQFVSKVLDWDYEYAPFRIEWVEEKKFRTVLPIGDGDRKVTIGGRIDRVDSKEGNFRVVDYKTGRDDTTFESIQSLFNGTGKRNKAAFQTTLYAWLYLRNNHMLAGQLTPLLIDRKNLFGDGPRSFEMGLSKPRITLDDVKSYLPEFESHLRGTLEDLFDQSRPFEQTTDVQHCEYCLFRQLCRR